MYVHVCGKIHIEMGTKEVLHIEIQAVNYAKESHQEEKSLKHISYREEIQSFYDCEISLVILDETIHS